MILSRIIEILRKKLPIFDESIGIFVNGESNEYPDIVNYLVANSVTAWSCQKLMSNYVCGSWDSNPRINDTQNLLKVSQAVANSLTTQRGVFIHFNYGFDENDNYVPIDARVLPFEDCRLGRKDDDQYNGLIGVSKSWNNDQNIRANYKNEKRFDWFHVYNPEVALYQANKNKFDYKGQVLFVNLDDFRYYPKSQIHPVMKDANSEIHASTYKEVSLEKGYFGSRWLVTRPMIDSELTDDHPVKQLQKREASSFEQNIQKSMGAENSQNVLWIQMDFDNVDDIDKQFVVKDFDTNINDKLFEFTEKSTSNNIRKSFNNIPALLVENLDNSMFGNSGEAIKQAQIYYFNNTKQERDVYIEIITHMLNALQIEIPFYIPLIKQDEATD